MGNALQIRAPKTFSQDGLNFRLRYGSKQFQIPFTKEQLIAHATEYASCNDFKLSLGPT